MSPEGTSINLNLESINTGLLRLTTSRLVEEILWNRATTLMAFKGYYHSAVGLRISQTIIISSSKFFCRSLYSCIPRQMINLSKKYRSPCLNTQQYYASVSTLAQSSAKPLESSQRSRTIRRHGSSLAITSSGSYKINPFAGQFRFWTRKRHNPSAYARPHHLEVTT
jgi:hypothetical protein